MVRQASIGVISLGLGPVGLETARRVLETAGMHLVGAVDISPELAGRPLDEVLDAPEADGLVVTPTLDEACELAKRGSGGPSPSVVLHCTGSSFPDELVRLRECLALGLHVVSSCEELAAPELRSPELASELIEEAKRRDLTIMATGVNPGFVMDRLPLVAAGMCMDLQRIEVRRVVDASTRRAQLQLKVGAGLSLEAYEEACLSQAVGHVGLAESLACICQGLGRPITLDEIEERLEPVMADRPLDSASGPIEPGRVAGTYQSVSTLRDGPPHLRLELTIAVGAGPQEDTVVVTGEPSFTLNIPGGLDGDLATCASLVNAVPLVVDAPAGLITPADTAGQRPLSEGR